MPTLGRPEQKITPASAEKATAPAQKNPAHERSDTEALFEGLIQIPVDRKCEDRARLMDRSKLLRMMLNLTNLTLKQKALWQSLTRDCVLGSIFQRHQSSNRIFDLSNYMRDIAVALRDLFNISGEQLEIDPATRDKILSISNRALTQGLINNFPATGQNPISIYEVLAPELDMVGPRKFLARQIATPDGRVPPEKSLGWRPTTFAVNPCPEPDAPKKSGSSSAGLQKGQNTSRETWEALENRLGPRKTARR